jgi:hypothetical protein
MRIVVCWFRSPQQPPLLPRLSSSWAGVVGGGLLLLYHKVGVCFCRTVSWILDCGLHHVILDRMQQLCMHLGCHASRQRGSTFMQAQPADSAAVSAEQLHVWASCRKPRGCYHVGAHRSLTSFFCMV